jgi:HEPN domain-containing protein
MKRVSDWLKQAERDLEEAIYSKKGGYYELACFLSQQSAEKAVKALLQYRGEERRGHSILHLLQSAPNEVKQCASYLDRQYIPSRYPDIYDEGAPYEYYTEKDAEECINCALMILSWVKSEIK